jgi:hypothetical protein
MPQPHQQPCPCPHPQQHTIAQTTTASFGPSVSFFVLFLVFFNQLTVFLHFAGYELLPTMGADVNKATLLPIQMGCEAVNTVMVVHTSQAQGNTQKST